jgi:hypothetical protein
MNPARASMPCPRPRRRRTARRLGALIRRRDRRRRRLDRFDRYMQLALYAPGLGYYTAGTRKFGGAATGGDFVTAPEISPLFAQALAAQVAQVFAHASPLHSRVRRRQWNAGARPAGRARARGTAAKATPSSRCRPTCASGSVPAGGDRAVRGSTRRRGFAGVIIANEVLDVMPVRLFVRTGGG